MRWSITDRPAKPASSAARATPVSQASGSSPHGNRLTWRTTFSPCEVRPLRRARRPAAGAPARRRRLVRAHGVHDVPALGSRPGDERPVPLELTGQRGRGHRPVPRGVAAPALGVRGVHHDGHGGQPDLAGPGQPARVAGPRRCRGCRRRWSARGRCGRRRPARAGRTRRPSRRGRAARCRRRRAARRRRRPRRAGSAPRPRSTCPSPTARPGPRAAGSGRLTRHDYDVLGRGGGSFAPGTLLGLAGRAGLAVGRGGPMLRATTAGEGPFAGTVASGPASASSSRFDGVNVVGAGSLGAADLRDDRCR